MAGWLLRQAVARTAERAVNAEIVYETISRRFERGCHVKKTSNGGLDSRLRGNDGGGAGMTDGGRTSRGEDGRVGFQPARE